MPLTRVVVAAIVLLVTLATGNEAQAQERHWGITFSLIPQWNPIQQWHDRLWDTDVDVDGNEFRVGVVRGSDSGGDWSVTFVRNTLKAAGTYDDTQITDFGFGLGAPVPITLGSLYTVEENPQVYAVKYEKFSPFVTIQDRVQIGVTYGGGIGALRGTYTDRQFDVEFGEFDPGTDLQSVTQLEIETQHDIKELYALDFVPIGSVELAVAAVVAPGFKVRIAGGLNFPYTQVFSVTAIVLVGR